ncbi:MAG TPA: mannose-6-phosphate isomerase [Candidatus Limnocylindria bacterium]|nr:mannose-6-phosphate isomerase [Candidatus Limnocylindria bacterium]
MAGLADALRDPISLRPNRIPRFYRGGRLLDTFRGEDDASDDDRPEDWVGSATRTWTPPGHASTDLGLSMVEIGGRSVSLLEMLDAEPEALIGEALLERAGPTLGLLVKLLDAGERLPVHCHPTRDAATRLLGSAFGKTEAWLILGVRDGSSPRVWAGFRDGVSHAQLRDWIDRQDTDALLGSLVEHTVAPGDAILIPAGTPHAIGAGIFLLELQEPTDFSVVAETRGFPITPEDATLGLGWDAAIGFFETDAVHGLSQTPAAVGGGPTRLLGPDADPFFRAVRMEVSGESSVNLEPGFAIGVVLNGSGEVRGASTALALQRGSTFALPAVAMPTARLAGSGLELVLCLPPEANLAPRRVD